MRSISVKEVILYDTTKALHDRLLGWGLVLLIAGNVISSSAMAELIATLGVILLYMGLVAWIING